MVHYEQGVYGIVRILYIGLCTLIRGIPLGDHLGPGTQSAGAADGQPPKRSLCWVCERAILQCVLEVDVRSHDAMNCCMRPLFQHLLETNIIPHRTVYQGLLTLRREFICEGLGETERIWRIHSAKPMRDGIREGETIGKSTGGNLVVIIGVTPTPDTAGGIRVPESAVLEI